MKKPLLINIFGASGTGKTILATTLANALKLKGINAEYCREWVKEPILNGLSTKSINQWTITGEQTRLLSLYMNCGCDVVITDSPVLVGKVYGEMNRIHNPDMPWMYWDEHCDRFLDAHKEISDETNTLNIMLIHDPKVNFQRFGREQDRKESILIELMMKKVVRDHLKIHSTAFLRDFLGSGHDSSINVLKALLEENKAISWDIKEFLYGL